MRNLSHYDEGGIVAASVAEVKRWKPRHELICLMHVAGRANNEIAPHVGVNQERVSYVINSKRGQARIEALRKQIIGGAARNIEEQLTILGPRAVANIAQTIEAEVPAVGRAKAHQDKVSFELLARIGYGRKDQSGGSGDTGIRLDRDIQERLAGALEKSSEATRIYDMEAQEAVIIEESPNGDRPHAD
jgi:hypothetical protein